MEPTDAGVADAAVWGAMVFFVFGLLFCYAGYSQLKPVTLRLDVPTRTYVLCTGWWLWRKEMQGSWADISQVSLHTYSPYGKGTTLFLYWRDPSRARFALHTDEAQEALRYRQVIARLLGIPYLGENWKLVYPEGAVPPVSPRAPQTPIGKEVPFATNPALQRELRTLAAWLALPARTALTLCNSYGNGLTLVREGHDKDAGRWICSTSLWKNDTLYVDAQGQVSEVQAAYSPVSASTRTTGSLPAREGTVSEGHWRLMRSANAETLLSQTRKGAAAVLEGEAKREGRVHRKQSI